VAFGTQQVALLVSVTGAYVTITFLAQIMTSFPALIILPRRRRRHPVRHSGHALLLRTKASVQVRQSFGESLQVFLPRYDMAHHRFRVGCPVRGPGHTVSGPGLLSGERLFFTKSCLQLIPRLFALS
jgi:hypothetical protein